MINRELIRIKVVQLTYGYYQNGNRNMDAAEKELLLSLSKAYDLYNFLLGLIVAITEEERHRIEILRKRAEREGLQMPSERFVNNKFALQLEENKQLNAFLANQTYHWGDDIEVVRRICDCIENSEVYNEYIASEDDTYETDRELWRKLYRSIIENNDLLDAALEDKSLYWNDDKEVVDTFVVKTIKRFDPANGADQELLPEFKDIADRQFAIDLFRSTIMNAETYQQYMSEASHNWDFSRLAYMDVVIMQIAIAEIVNFPNIPISVSINEYVNLAKLYSTPRSGGYINGMLDSIARHLVETGKVLKPIPEPRQRRFIKGHTDKRNSHPSVEGPEESE
ncbi:transcription antitermination factor NusB [Prevotella bivia]|uniref:transcription antitermination factor NusB n=1 Tax=Prevotella bivia TaxID=28125 RepID=UPI0007772210|nr:transcription antitermination factor NusB [Prevotella bivia]KXU56026.1 transcription antitermination factor NusB [Prevotella bivia]MDU5343593.1 transcription antitermination factor NusB [Prevotella bivia]